MSVPMALLDFVPVLLFLLAAVVLQRGLYAEMSKDGGLCGRPVLRRRPGNGPVQATFRGGDGP